MAINRREFLAGVGAGAMMLAVEKVLGAGEMAAGGGAGKPNIMMVLADDLAYMDAGCYGNKEVMTPNIDRLAREGMRFTNANAVSGMCVPCRTCLYTGLYPVKTGAFPNHSIAYPNIKSVAQYMKALGYRVALAGKIHVQPKEVFAFDYLPAKEEEVEKVMTGEGPFCLIYASIHPHVPWGRGIYDPAKLTIPPYMVDTPETRQALADYYHDVTEFDKEVGLCLGLLDKHGLTDKTLTFCLSEQGPQFPHGKWTCYELGIKGQFIARWPGKIAAGSTCDALMGYMDFVPTAVEVGGGKPIEGLDGKSLVGLFKGDKVEIHDALYGVQTTRGIIKGSECYPIRSIRTMTHKYIWNLKSDATFQNVVTADSAGKGYWHSWVEKAKTDPHAKFWVDAYQHRPEEELYDLRTDPLEMTNIAGNPANAALKADLRKRLEAFMKDQGDKGIETEMDAKNRQAPGRGDE